MNSFQTGLDRFSGGMTRAVRLLLMANVVAFLVQNLLLAGTGLDVLFALSRSGLRHGYIWQIVTYMFLHGSALHLIFNMLVLFFMGPETERTMGTQQFCILYFLSGILGGLGWLILSSSGEVCLGASGAIFGVLGAFAALYPHRRITLLLFLVLPVTMEAWVLVVGLAVIELLLMVGSSGGGVAHSAHLAGALAGYVYTMTVFKRGGGSLSQLWSRRPPRLRVMRTPQGPPPTPTSQAEIDRILEKIANQGMHSLTKSERTTLESASDSLRGRG